MKFRKPPSVVVIRPKTSTMDRDSDYPPMRKGAAKGYYKDLESCSVSESSSKGLLRRGRQWLKSSFSKGKKKPVRRTSQLRPSYQSNTESTDLLEFSQEFCVPRSESPEIMEEPVVEPSKQLKSPEPKNIESSSQTMLETIQPLHSKLSQQQRIETIDECEPIKTFIKPIHSTSKQMKRIEEGMPSQQTPNLLSNRRYSWKPIQADLFEIDERLPSTETQEELTLAQSKSKLFERRSETIIKSDEQEASQPEPVRMNRRKAIIKQSDKMERRNAIIVQDDDDCKLLRKLVQSKPKKQKKKRNKQKSKPKKQKGKQSRRRSSRSSIIFQNAAGPDSKADVPKSTETTEPFKPFWRMKVSFNSALIFVSGIMTAVLVMQLSMILDDWLASQMPEGMEWPMITKDLLASRMPVGVEWSDWITSLVQGGTHIS